MPAAICTLCRRGFQYVEQTVSQLVLILKSKGPKTVVDMDHAALRVTLDVIGQVGFGKDFGATKSLDEKDAANTAFATMEAGLALCTIYFSVSFEQFRHFKHFYCPSLTCNVAHGMTGHCACTTQSRSKCMAHKKDTHPDLGSPGTPGRHEATSCLASPVCR